jgi:uncharacterized membrane protein
MRTRIIGLFISALGLVDSVYLIFIKYANNEKLCFIGAGDCLSVNTSVYSETLGIPNAVLGAIAYIVIFALLFFEAKSVLIGRWSPYLTFGLTFLGVIYSAYLTYLEIAVIKAICPFCVVSAVIMLTLFIIAVGRLFVSAKDKSI